MVLKICWEEYSFSHKLKSGTVMCCGIGSGSWQPLELPVFFTHRCLVGYLVLCWHQLGTGVQLLVLLAISVNLGNN